MSFTKNIERYGKRFILMALRSVIKCEKARPEDLNPETVSRILVVRQDSRLGNLVLMSPLLGSLKWVFPNARIDVLISKGYEDILHGNPHVDSIVIFDKHKARYLPWWYPKFIVTLRKAGYDLAMDVSDGYHLSFNNIMVTSLSGARFRLGYDRGGAQTFLNLTVPVPPKNMYIADAMSGLVRFIAPDAPDAPIEYHLSESDRLFAEEWLKSNGIAGLTSFFAVHPGGKGRKLWGAENFAHLIDRLYHEIGVRIVVIGGKSEKKVIEQIRALSVSEFDVLENVTIGRMAAVIERCDMFISGDTGPMHVAAALNRAVVAIFISSNFHVYGPRGKRSRIVISREGEDSTLDVMVAIMDLLKNQL